jgi:hypothetical protein
MAGPPSPYSPFFIGQTFESIEDGIFAALDAIVAHGRSYKVAYSNQKRWGAVCRSSEETGCNFQIQIVHIDDSDKLNFESLFHTRVTQARILAGENQIQQGLLPAGITISLGAISG